VNAVKVDLADVAGVPGAHGRYSVCEQVPPIDGASVIGPVTGELTVQNTGLLLVVRGRLQAVLEVACARCLAPTQVPVRIKVEEEFAAEGASPDVDTIDREDPERAAIEDFVLDVTELVRQQLAVNVPMTSLCRPECQGICPQCGQNLNEGPCQCEPDTAGSPFSKLKDLLGEKPGGA
jgi:uncharacterized protein